MDLVYEGLAEQDLRAIVDYGIDNDLPDPVAFVETMRDRIATLATQPKSGIGGRVPDTREWPLAGTAYLVVYQVDEAEQLVRILRVLPPHPKKR